MHKNIGKRRVIQPKKEEPIFPYYTTVCNRWRVKNLFYLKHELELFLAPLKINVFLCGSSDLCLFLAWCFFLCLFFLWAAFFGAKINYNSQQFFRKIRWLSEPCFILHQRRKLRDKNKLWTKRWPIVIPDVTWRGTQTHTQKKNEKLISLKYRWSLSTPWCMNTWRRARSDLMR